MAEKQRLLFSVGNLKNITKEYHTRSTYANFIFAFLVKITSI